MESLRDVPVLLFCTFIVIFIVWIMYKFIHHDFSYKSQKGLGHSYSVNKNGGYIIPEINSSEWIVYVLTIALANSQGRTKFFLCNLVDEVLVIYRVSDKKNRAVIMDALWLDCPSEMLYENELWYPPDDVDKRRKNILDTISRLEKCIPKYTNEQRTN